MTNDLGSTPNPVDSNTSTPSSRFNLRSCLLVGVGCLAILAVGLCIAVAFFLPRVRTVVEDFGSRLNIDTLQQLEDLTVPSDLLEEALGVPTNPSDLCAERLCLNYPARSGFVAEVRTQAAELEVDFWAIPEHLEFSFTGYTAGYVPGNTFFSPHIGMYDTASFSQVNPNVASQLNDLEALLNSKPAAPDYIPLIPVFNAQQVITASVAYFEFEWGSGVRFVTFYSQGIVPISNYELFYAFTGLSHDGSVLITAIMPIANQDLPDDPNSAVGGDYDTFAQGYEEYVATTEAMLNGAGSGTFTPSLDQLDALMQSFQLLPAP